MYVEANASIQQYETEDGSKRSSINLVQRKSWNHNHNRKKIHINSLIESINKLAGVRADRAEAEAEVEQ